MAPDGAISIFDGAIFNGAICDGAIFMPAIFDGAILMCAIFDGAILYVITICIWDHSQMRSCQLAHSWRLSNQISVIFRS